jgi:2-polyprenyl-3-methyl-5-hydroxy-6-metoxy-1,4-benzoquinol methylase
MNDPQTTTERLYSKYHSFNQRPEVTDPEVRCVSGKSFKRSLGAWLPADRSSRILDIACGEGALLDFLRTEGFTALSGFDISPENVRLCHEIGLPFVQQADALRLAERPESGFELILAFDLIEHLPKQSAASFLEQVRAKLAPRGSIVLQTPNMGSLYAAHNRYYDLSHEFGVTEKSAIDLLMLSGFERRAIEVKPSWTATTSLGRLREWHVRFMHHLIFIGEGSRRPRIPTMNLLIRATRPKA